MWIAKCATRIYLGRDIVNASRRDPSAFELRTHGRTQINERLIGLRAREAARHNARTAHGLTDLRRDIDAHFEATGSNAWPNSGN